MEGGSLKFQNAYDEQRAKAYATLKFHDTYYLAFRDLPRLIADHVRGKEALDFGCGAGRSTRFLRQLGMQTIGVDISTGMLAHAQTIDPKGDYRLIGDGDLSSFAAGAFDLILSAFSFDNIPGEDHKVAIFRELNRVLRRDGHMVNLVSTPNIYLYEWATFTTAQFKENREAKPGDIVRTITKNSADSRPCDDILWPDEDYRRVYAAAGFKVVEKLLPLADGSEPYEWVNETHIAPWAIYLLKPVI